MRRTLLAPPPKASNTEHPVQGGVFCIETNIVIHGERRITPSARRSPRVIRHTARHDFPRRCTAPATVLLFDTMNSKQRSALKAIFSKPIPNTLEWLRIESLFVAAGARVIEGNGSRVRFELNGVVATFHRPHPDKEAKPYQVRDARAFLEQAGVTP